jgi:hypothetical protein
LRTKARRKTARKSARPSRRKTTPAARQTHKAVRKSVQKSVPSPIRSRGVLVAIVALSGAVIVAAMGRLRGPEIAAADVLLPPAAHLDVVPGAPEIESAPMTGPEQRARTAMTDAPAAAAPAAAAPAPALPPAPEVTDEPPAVDPAVLVTPAATIDPPTATMAGCLTFDDGEYRLKDATGTDAPKSRNWKSGFMARRPATIDIVDSSQSLALAAHVGQRVEIGGTLVAREMQARSLHRLAESCKK